MGEAPRIQCRALSLTQPWASLVALGLKRIETRSWATPYRGWLVIQAAASFPPYARRLCDEAPFRQLLEGAGLAEDTLPLRAALGVCQLIGCIRITASYPDRLRPALETALGDYTPGRSAWQLAGARPFRRPYSTRGYLGLWWWTAPVNFRDLEPEISALLEEEVRHA